MDETLNALLIAPDGLDAATIAHRVHVLVVLGLTLPKLDHLSQDEWQAKLAAIEDDVEQLREAAHKAVGRFDQGRRALETLTHYAESYADYVAEQRPPPALTDDETLGSNEARANDDPFNDLVAEAETTRDAIVTVMASKPQRAWSAVTITDALARYGRPVTRSNVQVSLRRLADDGLVHKVERGRYQVVSDVLTGPPGQQIPDRQAEISRKALVRRDAALKASRTRARNRQVHGLPME